MGKSKKRTINWKIISSYYSATSNNWLIWVLLLALLSTQIGYTSIASTIIIYFLTFFYFRFIFGIRSVTSFPQLSINFVVFNLYIQICIGIRHTYRKTILHTLLIFFFFFVFPKYLVQVIVVILITTTLSRVFIFVFDFSVELLSYFVYLVIDFIIIFK